HWVPDQLDRDALLELPVGALAEEDLPHAPFADRANDPKRPDALWRAFAFEQQRRQSRSRRCVEDASGPLVRAQQLNDFGAQPAVAQAGTIDVRRLLFGWKLEHGVEHGVNASEPIVRGRGQGTLLVGGDSTSPNMRRSAPRC